MYNIGEIYSKNKIYDLYLIMDNLTNFTLKLEDITTEKPVGEICGYSNFQKEKLCINVFYINKKYRYQGMGSAMIYSLVNIYKRYTKDIEVFPISERAIPFYEKIGFKILDDKNYLYARSDVYNLITQLEKKLKSYNIKITLYYEDNLFKNIYKISIL